MVYLDFPQSRLSYFPFRYPGCIIKWRSFHGYGEGCVALVEYDEEREREREMAREREGEIVRVCLCL